MADKTSWIFELIDRFSGPAKKLIGVVERVDKAAGFADKSLRGLANIEGSKLFVAAANASNLVGQIEALTDKTAKYSDMLSDVQKTTGFTAAQTGELADKLNGLNTRTGINELLDISRVAGEFGIRSVDAAANFTRAVNYANVALGDQFGSAENTARALGKISALYGDTKIMNHAEALTKVGSILNDLGNRYGTNANEVSDFVQRMGQLGNLGPTLSQTAGYGGLLIKMGLTSEQAAGGLTKVITTAAKEAKVFAKGLGMTEDAFKKMVNTDPDGMIKRLIGSLSKLSPTQVVAVLDKLKLGGDQETLKTVLTLSSNLGKLTEFQRNTSDAFIQGSSVLEEATLKENNLAAAVARVKNQFEQWTVGLGQSLGAMLPMLYGAGTLLVTIVNLGPALQALGVAYSFAAGKAVLAGTATRRFTLAQWANLKAVAASGLRYIWFASVSLVSFIGSLFGATAAQWALNVALNANPIGLVVIAVAAAIGAIALLIRYWDKIKVALINFGKWLLDKNPITGPIIWVVKLLERVFPETFEKIKASFGNFWAWLTGWLEKAWGGIKWLWEKVKGFLGLGSESASPKIAFEAQSTMNYSYAMNPALAKWAPPSFPERKSGETTESPDIFKLLGTGDKKGKSGDASLESSSSSASARSITMNLNLTQNIHATKEMDIEKLKRTLIELIVDAGRDAGVTLAGA